MLPVGLPGPDHGRVVEPARGVVGAVAVGRVVLHVEVVPAAAAVLVLHPEAAVEHAGVSVGAGWALLEVDAEVDACFVAARHFEGRENWSGEMKEKKNIKTDWRSVPDGVPELCEMMKMVIVC